MTNEEQKFIYERMNFLYETVQNQEKQMYEMVKTFDKVLDHIENIMDLIKQISSEEYHKKMQTNSEVNDLMDKIKFFRSLANKQ